MHSIPRHPRRLAAALVLVTAAGAALGGGMAAAGQGADGGRASCELRVSRQAGTVALTALARAETGVAGSYSLKVSGRGTDIRQGGPFRAAPGRPAVLGTVTLDANGAGYRADLELVVDGDAMSCSKRIGGGI